LTPSVIIPTHNRREAVTRALGALSKQVYFAGDFEVIVVADGCTDDTVFSLRKQLLCYPFTLRVLEQPGSGPAAARNTGADHARGDILIFMDDDIEPLPGFVSAHCAAHNNVRRVVIGHCPPRLTRQDGFFRYVLEGWWTEIFDRMGQPGHRFSYTDLLSGNLSLSRRLFMEVGGFDPRFICHEDYEIGVRLLRARAEFIFEPSAKGYHYEMSDIRRVLERKFQEGKADVVLGQLYPELCSSLLISILYRKAFLFIQIVSPFTFRWPRTGDRIARLLGMLLPVVEGIKLRRVWRRVLKNLMGYWYWRGVAQELPIRGALSHYLYKRSTAKGDPLEVNLADGIEQVKQEIDKKRPMNLKIFYNATEIGTTPPKYDCERLRGAHLYPILTRDLRAQTLRVLAQANTLDIPIDREILIKRCDEFIAFKEKHGYAPS
jgi:glycosyltransferase involved in cell wall biosynthesis